MLSITRPAAPIKQIGMKLYSTSMRVGDLLMENFISIERLDPSKPGNKGYQRVLNLTRAKKLAEYLINGIDTGDAFLPTSILIATEKDVLFDKKRNTITINPETMGPFNVVDGQHRFEGLRIAAHLDGRLRDFEIPVNIASGLDMTAQMAHFLIVNTTQKSVEKGVEQRIYARLTSMIDLQHIPTLPKWIQRIMERGEDERALLLIDHLNSQFESPWYQKIEVPGRPAKSPTIQQSSFVTSIKRHLLTPSNPFMAQAADIEKQKKILTNYWIAIAEILDDGQPSVLFKTIGVELFLRFSTALFMKLDGDYKIHSIQEKLRSTFESIDGDYADVGYPEFWHSGTGKAGGLNSVAIGNLNKELHAALHTLGKVVQL